MDPQSDWMHRFHSGEDTVTGTGVLDVRRGRRWPPRLVGTLLRLPPTGRSVPVHVQVVRSRDGRTAEGRSGPGPTGHRARRQERWIRQIGSRRLESVQTHDGSLVREHLGPVELRMRMVSDEAVVRWRPDGAALCVGRRRLRLPRWCAPRASAQVWTRPGFPRPRFELRVRIDVPAVGLLLSYSGHLEEDTDG